MSVVFALLSSLCNAVNAQTQHVASISSPEGTKGWDFLRYLIRSPLWLLGWVALAGSFVFQVLALYNGALSVVQPLLVTELVFALILRRVWIRQTIRPVTWAAATVTTAGLAVFLVVAEPRGTDVLPSAQAWISASVAFSVLTGVLALLGLRGTPGRRAALLGSASAVLWALVAAFMKATADSFGQHGLGGFAHWPVYALAAGGLVAEILNQATLHVGPLSASQPFLVIIDPVVSILLSVWVFGEQFTPDPRALAVGSLAFAVMCVAVVVLIRTSPTTMDPTERPAPAVT